MGPVLVNTWYAVVGFSRFSAPRTSRSATTPFWLYRHAPNSSPTSDRVRDCAPSATTSSRACTFRAPDEGGAEDKGKLDDNGDGADDDKLDDDDDVDVVVDVDDGDDDDKVDEGNEPKSSKDCVARPSRRKGPARPPSPCSTDAMVPRAKAMLPPGPLREVPAAAEGYAAWSVTRPRATAF